MAKVYLANNRDGRSGDVKKWFKGKKLSRLAGLSAGPAAADFFLVAGGDGAMLNAIRLYGRYRKPFFGINRGTGGFLLNRIKSPAELIKVLKNFSACDLVRLYLLKGEFGAGRSKKSFYAFNDFYLKSSRGNERVIGSVRGEKKFSPRQFDGDGLIVSTPQGSTAYNRAAGGKILPLGSSRLSVKSICSRKEVNLAVPEQKITVEITRGRAAVYADHGRVASGVKKMAVWPSRRPVILAFKPGHDFETKRRRA